MGILPGEAQGQEVWESLILYTRVHSPQGKMKLRSLNQTYPQHTIQQAVVFGKSKSFSACVASPSLLCLPKCLWGTCCLYGSVTSPELEPRPS